MLFNGWIGVFVTVGINVGVKVDEGVRVTVGVFVWVATFVERATSFTLQEQSIMLITTNICTTVCFFMIIDL